MNETLSFLYSLRNRGSSFGIDRMAKFVKLLGNPHLGFPVIHVAGTNGKGSVCAMLDSIYRANGYKVGLFSSPHLIELGERIRINGENITEEEINQWVEQIKPIAQKMEEDESENHPTFFEFMTAIAFLNFQKQGVDLAIIETGLGGRLDSTNVVIPELSIITSISKDHCAILGDTLEEITGEKAGIIKKEIPVLIGDLPNCSVEVVEQVAVQQNSELYSIDRFLKEERPQTNLQGSYQRANAALALRGSEILREQFPVEDDLVSKGLNQVSLQGRWQIIEGPPRVILDACHNSGGAICLRENLAALPEKPEIWLGVLGEDRAKEIIDVVLDFASSVILFEVEQPRACTVDYLRSLIPHSFKGQVIDLNLEKARDKLKNSRSNGTILVTGSIYLIGDILRVLTEQDLYQNTNWNDLF
ncbi:MAG: bifunctional folylpolyglutamate synthase/dihydrofolate synthase [Opitutales bacterium]|nr:bifunctional folylpolyglutamate synthase/dihydrofolate synthase [Opitutales bacterium]